MSLNGLTKIFREIADLMELMGENPFKIRAYQNAIRVFEGVGESLDELIRKGQLKKLPGIGEGLAKKVLEYAKTGRVRFHENLQAKVPRGLLEMLKINGLGSRKVRTVWKKLKITNIKGLERACQENRIARLAGFGEKSQKKILEGIGYLKRSKGRFLYPVGARSAEYVLKKLEGHPDIQRAGIAGSLRRRKEIIKDIDIVVSARKPSGIMKYFTSLKEVRSVMAHGKTKSSVELENGLRVDLRVVTDKEFPYALHHLTGGKEHHTALRARAKRARYKINEYGLFRGSRLVPCKTEQDIYKRLGLVFIEPELRENMGEIEAAESRRLPHLIRERDIRGVFHAHTTYSDGSAGIEEMAHRAESLGYEYIGISDHSQSAVYANGLKEDRIRKQHREMDRVNKKLKKIRIFKGIECDILSDGSMDYPDRVLSSLDFCIASVHSHFNMSKSEMTKRVVRALKNRYVNMLGHSTGRLLLVREEYAIDLKEVIRAAVGEGKVIELNANPYRLDLDWRLLKAAKEEGLKVSINPDAHNPEGLSDTALGVGIARKGWLEASDVVNTLPRNKMLAFLKNQRKGRSF